MQGTNMQGASMAFKHWIAGCLKCQVWACSNWACWVHMHRVPEALVLGAGIRFIVYW